MLGPKRRLRSGGTSTGAISKGKYARYFLWMATDSPETVVRTREELDPLAYLRCSKIVQYKKDRMIYGPNEPANSIYLIISGKVQVSCVTELGRPFVADIYVPDEFFGEAAFVEPSRRTESALAI